MKKLILCFCILAIAQLHSFAQTPTISLSSNIHNGYEISCYGGRDGAITSTITNGTPPYTYEWSNGATTANISNLAQGYYHVWVLDNNGNRMEAEITLKEPRPMDFGFTVNTFANGYNVSCFFCTDGSINTNLSGGVTPYTFAWNDGSTFQNRTGLQAKYYAVIITDANGCVKQREGVTLTAPNRDDWQLGGNNSTNPATQYLGTNDNTDFSIRSYNIERLRVLANGNIKVSSLAGGAGMVYVDTDGTLKNSNADLNAAPCTVAPNAPTWSGYSQTGTNAPLLWTCPSINVNIGSFSYPATGFKFNVYGNSYFQNNVSIGSPSTSTGVRFLVTGKSYFNGDVGVGTNNPLGIFEAKGSSPYLYVSDNGGGSASLNLKNNSGFWHISGPRGGNEVNSPLGIFYNNNSSFSRVMSLLNNGTVIIGSAIPDNAFLGANGSSYKLLVDGNVGAREIRVKAAGNPWPDYVFDKDYKLPSLAQTEKFIATQKHLPGFPSAVEIENDGQNVGQLQVQQQESMEQLYLHVIALEKRMAAVEAENKRLEAENLKLRERK